MTKLISVATLATFLSFGVLPGPAQAKKPFRAKRGTLAKGVAKVGLGVAGAVVPGGNILSSARRRRARARKKTFGSKLGGFAKGVATVGLGVAGAVVPGGNVLSSARRRATKKSFGQKLGKLTKGVVQYRESDFNFVSRSKTTKPRRGTVKGFAPLKPAEFFKAATGSKSLQRPIVRK